MLPLQLIHPAATSNRRMAMVESPRFSHQTKNRLEARSWAHRV
jgi:hypothetical protein